MVSDDLFGIALASQIHNLVSEVSEGLCCDSAVVLRGFNHKLSQCEL